MTTALSVLRPRFLQVYDLGLAIPNANVDAFVSGSFTSAYHLRDSQKGSNHYSNRNTVISRPGTATAADAIRYAGALTNSSGLLAHTGANYTDITVGTETVELWYDGVRPDYGVLNSLNRALEYITYSAWEPLSRAPDAAMRESSTSSWGTAVTCTAAKQTTAARVYPGFLRSMSTTNSSANGYIPTANITVSQNKNVLVAALARLQSGTSAQMTLYDASNATVFPSTTSAYAFTESTWQVIMVNVQVPNNCFNINVRLGGTGASDVVDWQALWVYQKDAAEPFILPSSYLNEHFELTDIGVSTWGAGNSESSNVYEGLSLAIAEIPKQDYSANFMRPAANPAFVEFHKRDYFDYPLWLQMKLPYSERGTFSAESDTWTGPDHLLYPRWGMEFFSSEGAHVKDAEKKLLRCMKEFQDASRIRVQEPVANKRQTGILMGGI